MRDLKQRIQDLKDEYESVFSGVSLEKKKLTLQDLESK